MLNRYEDSLEQDVAFAVRLVAFYVSIGVLFLRGPIASVYAAAICSGLGEPLAIYVTRRYQGQTHEQAV